MQCQLLNRVRTEETTKTKTVISDVVLRLDVLRNATSACGPTACETGDLCYRPRDLAMPFPFGEARNWS